MNATAQKTQVAADSLSSLSVAVLLCLLVLLSAITRQSVAQESSSSEDILAFETQLDTTIRSACHGYMVDSIPDFLSSARDWLNENTPFCQTVRTLPEASSAAAALQTYSQEQGQPLELETDQRVVRYYGRNDAIYTECQDWMCQHIRTQLREQSQAISFSDYQRVEAHCEQHYGCIESWFKTWPRPLPEAAADRAKLTLDGLMGNEVQSPSAVKESKPAQAAHAAQASQAEHVAQPSGLSLDDLMAGDTQKPQSTHQAQQGLNTGQSSALGLDTTLDNIYAGREQVQLEQALADQRQMSQRLNELCQCSVTNAGCYQLPSESLLEAAGKREQSRFAQCSEWQALSEQQPANSQAVNAVTQSMKAIELRVQDIDQDMDNRIASWHEEQRRLAEAQRQQQQNDSGWFAGVAAIALQAGAVANGTLSAEQAADNAVNVAQRVDQGDSWASAMAGTISSSIPNYPSSSAGSTVTSALGGNNFACRDPRLNICIEYRLNSANKVQQFKNQCQQGGNQLLSSCPKQGPSCSQSSSLGGQTTYSPGTSAERVRQACIASGGQFSP